MNTKLAILYITLYIVTFFIILPLLCNNMKHSIYYTGWRRGLSERRQEIVELNSQRMAHAFSYLSTLNRTKQFPKIQNLDVLITVVTMDRTNHLAKAHNLYYLTQTVSKLLYLLKQRNSMNMNIVLCNVDGQAQSHSEVKELLPYVRTIFTRFRDAYYLDTDPKEKEKEDYVYCLNQSLELNPSYVLILEDDALPHDNIFIALKWLLEFHFADHSHSHAHNTAYVKLYRPERLLGFLSDAHSFLELIFTSAIVAGILIVLKALIWKDKCRNNNCPHLWLYFFVYIMLICLSVGRQNFLDLRAKILHDSFYVAEAPKCCTPAVLYPAHSIPNIVQALDESFCMKHYSKDDALDDYVEKHPEQKAYLLQPNVVQHIGYYSSVRRRFIDPSNV